jgi:tetratricopeptide (TPR) repeat protein
VECPQPVINFPETGRIWLWLRYTVVKEDDQWMLQTISDEAAAAIELPAAELIQKIEFNNTQILQVAKEIDAEGEDEDEDDLDGDFVEAKLVEVDTHSVAANNERIVEEVITINADEDEEDEDEEEFENEVDLFTDALDHMDSMVRLVTQSLHYYDAIFAQDPVKHPELYKEAFNLASTIFDIERAAAYAQQAAKHVPAERSDALRNLAISYQALAIKCHNEDDHEEEARFDALIEPTLRQALAVEESPDNLITLATVLIQRDKDLDEAKKFLIKAQKGPLSPEGTASIELGLGEIAMFNEEEEEALSHFQKLVALTPDDEQAWYNLGYLHHQLEHFDEAIAALNTSIELDPELTEAYTELASLYLTQGNPRKAREITSEGLDENPDAADIHATMAQIYMFSGDYRNANKFLTQAEQLDDEDEFVQLTRQRYNIESKRQLTQKKSQPKQKQKQNKAKKR